MATVNIYCAQCREQKPCEASRANEANKKGLPLYCGRKCAGLARRKAAEECISPRNPNWKKLKSAYDKKRREEKREEIKAKKAAAYAIYGPANRDKEREIRKKRMPLHVEYCRKPEYRVKKEKYDRKRRAVMQFGEFAEAFLAVQELDREIESRADFNQLAAAKGTVNKSKQRRRDYERITGKAKANRYQPEGFPLGHSQPDQVRQNASSAG